jgi:alpha-D-xyloside xylohydrolase
MQLPPPNQSHRWPSPLDDPDIAIDAISGVDGSTLRLESGQTVPFRATAPVPGILRLRVGPGTTHVPSFLRYDAAAEVDATISASDRGVEISGAGVTATIDATGLLTCGSLQTVPSRGVLGGRMATGRVASTSDPTEPPGWSISFALGPGDRLFGTGEAFLGPDLRGRIRRILNLETHALCGTDASYLTTPFLWSDAGWAMLVATSGPVRADLGAGRLDTAAVVSLGDDLDVFLWTGESPAEIVAGYHALTGLPGRLPPWAYGVWSSRCSYFSEKELNAIVDGYEAAECPLEAVHVDAWVTGNVIRDLTCNWTIDRDRFPVGWGERLAERGIHVSLWHNPYVLEGTDVADELGGLGYLLSRADGTLATTGDLPRFIIDFTNPGAVAWWEDRVRSVATAEGNVAFKPDFAEEIPLDVRPFDGRPGWALRNEYALLYQEATHRGLSDVLGDEAVALFCRSGTAGAQANPVHWVGDTPSTWDGLEGALRACASLSLSGFGLVAHDVGGFYTTVSWTDCAEAADTFDGSKLWADVDPELFGRWTQWGALSPVCRFHGTGRREPWAYAEPWGSVAVAACRLRERLRPYLVRAGDEAATIGTPVLRPPVWTHPDLPEARAADLQYLLGPDVLVAPILKPGGVRQLWVPPGRWRPLLGLDPVEGPAFITVTCGPDQFPAWAREGADVVS